MSRIAIANPPPGCVRYTSKSAAERHVRQGRAVLEGGRLRFLETSERHAATRRNSELGKILAAPPEDSVTAHGMARLNQVQGLPCVGPAVRLFTILSKRGSGYRPAL